MQKKAWEKIALHTVEAAVITTLGIVILHMFAGDALVASEVKLGLLMVLGSFIAKYFRASPSVPINDYVNE